MQTVISNKSILDRYLKELRLPGIRGYYEDFIRLAIKESLGYGDFFLGLFEGESGERTDKRIMRLMR